MMKTLSFSLILIILLFFTACEDQTTTQENFNCNLCNDWETCDTKNNKCNLSTGKCLDRTNCASDQICTDHICIDACTSNTDCKDELENKLCNTDSTQEGFGLCYRPECINNLECDGSKSRCNTENDLYKCDFPLSEGCDPKKETCFNISGEEGKCILLSGENHSIDTMCYNQTELDKFEELGLRKEGALCDPLNQIICEAGMLCNDNGICQKLSFDETCSGENISVPINLYTGQETISLCGCTTHDNCSEQSFCLSNTDDSSSYDRYCEIIEASESTNDFCPDSSWNNDGICSRYDDQDKCNTSLNASFDSDKMQCIPDFCNDSGENCSGYSTCNLDFNICIPYEMPLTQISSGVDHICAVQIDKTVKCIGKADHEAAELLDDAGLLTDVKMVSSGKDHSCAIAMEKVYCWGKSDFNEVNQRNTNTNTPELVEITDFVAKKVVARQEYSCALGKHNGIKKIFCWGENKNNLLNDTTEKVTVASETIFKDGDNTVIPIDLFGSEESICVIDQFHKTYCRGSITGNLNSADNANPIKFIQGSIGAKHICSLEEGQKVFCAGDGSNGQMGNGTTLSENDINTAVMGLSAMTFMVASGSSHSCSISKTKAACWGDNSKMQLGDNEFTDSYSSTKLINYTTSNARKIQSIDLNYNQSCISVWSDADHTGIEYYCWGELFDGIKNTPTTINFP